MELWIESHSRVQAGSEFTTHRALDAGKNCIEWATLYASLVLQAGRTNDTM